MNILLKSLFVILTTIAVTLFSMIVASFIARASSDMGWDGLADVLGGFFIGLIVGLIIGLGLAARLDRAGATKGSLIAVAIVVLEIAFVTIANATGYW